MKNNSFAYMSKEASVCILMLLFATVVFSGEKSKDYEYNSHTTIHIKQQTDTSYSLNTESKVSFKYLTHKSTEDDEFSISQGSFDVVRDIEAQLNSKSISNENISFHYAEDEDIFISDYIIHTIKLSKKPNIGDVVTYSYEREYKAFEYLPTVWVGNYETIQSILYEYRHPSDVTITFETFFPGDSIAYQIINESPTKTILRIENIKERKVNSFFPYNNTLAVFLPVVKCKGKNLLPITAQEFSDWYLRFFTFDTTIPTSKGTELRAQIQNATTVRDKIKTIYDYVRKNVRYIAEEESLGAIVPRPPLKVLERGFGDCKDKAFLITSLAKEYNLPVKFVLISTEYTPTFKSYVHRSLFNHAICLAQIDGKDVFMDPTCKECEFENLPDHDMGHNALIVDNKNSQYYTAVPTLSQLPSCEVTIKGNIEDLKNATATLILRNDYLWSAIKGKESMADDEFNSMLSRYTTNDFQKIIIDSFVVQKQDYNSMTLTAKADLSTFIISSTEKKYIPQVPFKMLDNNILEREQDSLPLYFMYRNYLILNIELDTKGFNTKPTSLKYQVGNTNLLSAECTSGANGLLRMHCEMKKDGTIYAGSQKQQMLEYSKQFLASKKLMNVLTK